MKIEFTDEELEKILDFVEMDDGDACELILEGASEADIESYYRQFPEYRKYRRYRS